MYALYGIIMISSYYVSTFNICNTLEEVAKDYTGVIVGWGQL